LCGNSMHSGEKVVPQGEAGMDYGEADMRRR
jgi:hypothetical protein